MRAPAAEEAHSSTLRARVLDVRLRREFRAALVFSRAPRRTRRYASVLVSLLVRPAATHRRLGGIWRRCRGGAREGFGSLPLGGTAPRKAKTACCQGACEPCVSQEDRLHNNHSSTWLTDKADTLCVLGAWPRAYIRQSNLRIAHCRAAKPPSNRSTAARHVSDSPRRTSATGAGRRAGVASSRSSRRVVALCDATEGHPRRFASIGATRQTA